MAHLITFATSRFDTAAETPNPFNPIAGESVLQWLGEKLAECGYEATEPAAEDWGWYIEVHGPGAAYLVGASADPAQAAPSEWAIQIHRHRSWIDRLFGRNPLADDDPLSACVERLIREDAGAQDVLVDKHA